jgi:hypothetical protein
MTSRIKIKTNVFITHARAGSVFLIFNFSIISPPPKRGYEIYKLLGEKICNGAQSPGVFTFLEVTSAKYSRLISCVVHVYFSDSEEKRMELNFSPHFRFSIETRILSLCFTTRVEAGSNTSTVNL